nr:hypothetical protein [Candidatus Sigynarchaeota archaeon]
MMTAKLLPTSAAKLARDLRADLRQLKSRGIDPATFLSGTLVRIYRKVEKAARRGEELPTVDYFARFGEYSRLV